MIKRTPITFHSRLGSYFGAFFGALSILSLAVVVWRFSNDWLLHLDPDYVSIPDDMRTAANKNDGQTVWPFKFSAKATSALSAPPAQNSNYSWSYEGASGPANWSALSRDNVACGNGKFQSPIDIPRRAVASVENLRLNWVPEVTGVGNQGPLTELSLTGGSRTVLHGEDFVLKRMLFHSPSEHQLSGLTFPMEVQFIHESSSGKIAIFGVFVEIGSPLPEVEDILPHIQVAAQSPTKIGSFNPRKLVPNNVQHFRYQGSLTNPPCTEGVSWFVFTNAIEMSAEQVVAFRAAHGQSSRPLQPIGSRSFEVDMSLRSH